MKGAPGIPTFEPLPSNFEALQLGIWRVIIKRDDLKPAASSLTERLYNFRKKIEEANVIRLFKDVYHAGPSLFIVSVSYDFLRGVEDAVSLWSLNRLLNLIETGYRNQHQDTYEIVKALSIRVFFIILLSTVRWIHAHTKPMLTTRVKCFFEERILEAHLSVDLPTSEKNSGAVNASPLTAWDSVESLLATLRVLWTAVSQLLLIMSFSGSWKDSSVIFFLCVLWPIFRSISYTSLWQFTFIGYSTNIPYRRLRTLSDLACEQWYKKEVISGGLSKWIMREYRKARASMGDANDKYPWDLYMSTSTPISDIAVAILQDFPLIFYALDCVWNRSSMSVASLATLQRIASALEATITAVVRQKNNIFDTLRAVRELYAVYGSISDSDAHLLPYCPPEDLGMEIELRNVSFRYPTADEAQEAVKHVSFKLEPSSLVVIVGANGSGKSSIVNLLSRLYHPTSGELWVDGRPVQSYRRSDIQQSIALLTQDHHLFGFSIAENIGIGDPDAVDDIQRIEDAARLGGSYGFIQKCTYGFNDTLQYPSSTLASEYPVKDEVLREMLDTVEKHKEVSGGERQRLAASRTFMRIMSKKIKLVVVDEPTSAMDPEGEYELFEKLRLSRTGKTMVFVTHRFGHLTRHADMILCMKNGELIESGTHQELINQHGEYYKLYRIQASAFVDGQTMHDT